MVALAQDSVGEVGLDPQALGYLPLCLSSLAACHHDLGRIVAALSAIDEAIAAEEAALRA